MNGLQTSIEMQRIAACPICGGAMEPLGLSEEYTLKALGARVRIDFGICRACSFVCQTSVLPLDALMRYYRDSPKLREGKPSATDRDLYAAQAAFMASAAPLRETSVLDVGADMGKLLDHLAADYGCRTFYQEENATAKAWLREHGRHADAADPSGCAPFDWIVLSQVLEHIVDPVAMLQGLRTLSAPDGKLFVEVPNHGFWDESDIGLFFEHVNYFSPASLTAALDRAGFHVLSLSVTSDRHYFNGRCRIIRACAQRYPEALLRDAAGAVREHERRHKTARLEAVDALSRELVRDGKPGLALYGAADLADQVFRQTGAQRERIAAIFDSDVRKHGQDFQGFTVLPPSEILSVAPGAIVILSSAETDIARTIEGLGYRGRVVCWSDL